MKKKTVEEPTSEIMQEAKRITKEKIRTRRMVKMFIYFGSLFVLVIFSGMFHLIPVFTKEDYWVLLLITFILTVFLPSDLSEHLPIRNNLKFKMKVTEEYKKLLIETHHTLI